MTGNKKIAIGADHNGMPLKNVLRDHLINKGFKVDDYGVNSSDPVDYPDIAAQVSKQVSEGRYKRAILVCGTGAGMAIVANKFPNVRAVCVFDPYTAERAIASNDAHVITFGSQTTGPEVAKMLVDIWLANEFQGGRSAPKVQKINDLDAKYRKERA